MEVEFVCEFACSYIHNLMSDDQYDCGVHVY